MSNNKNYTQRTLDQLLAEEKNIKKQEIISAVIIGFSVGVMIFGLVKNGFGFIYIVLPSLLIYGIYKNSQKLKANQKQIRAEIEARNME